MNLQEAINLVNENVVNFKSLPAIHKENKDLVLKVVKYDGYYLQYISNNLKKDKDIVLEETKRVFCRVCGQKS